MLSVPLRSTETERFALDAMVESEQEPLLRLARRFGFDREECRDLVQSTFADAFEKQGQLRDAAVAPAWLRKILVSRATSQLRRKRVKERVLRFFGVEPTTTPSPDDHDDRAALISIVRDRVSALPMQQRVAVTLRYFEGLSVDEVAQTMNIAHGTARIHLYRGLAALKELGGHNEL